MEQTLIVGMSIKEEAEVWPHFFLQKRIRATKSKKKNTQKIFFSFLFRAVRCIFFGGGKSKFQEFGQNSERKKSTQRWNFVKKK